MKKKVKWAARIQFKTKYEEPLCEDQLLITQNGYSVYLFDKKVYLVNIKEIMQLVDLCN